MRRQCRVLGTHAKRELSFWEIFLATMVKMELWPIEGGGCLPSAKQETKTQVDSELAVLVHVQS